MAGRNTPNFGATVKVGPVRVESVHLSYAASVLRSHGVRKQILREIEKGVVLATPKEDNAGMPRGSGVSDPTSAAAMRLDNPKEPTFRSRAHMRLLLNSVEELYKTLPEDQQAILNSLYILGDKTLVGVALTLHMSKATVVRRRNMALLALARHIIGDQIILPPA